MASRDDVPVRFGRLLREARLNANLSQDELAYRAGISRNYVGEIERGTRCPSLPIVVRLARGLGARLTDLLAPLDDLPRPRR